MPARQEIVDILVNDKIRQLASDADFARDMLSRGFPGFINMSASQLRYMVCAAGLESREGMGLLLHELSQEESILTRAPRNQEGITLPVTSVDPLRALSTELRRYFQNEASAPMVKIMLETLGPLSDSVRADDHFKALDELTATQLRRLIPVSLGLRERVRRLLAALEEQA